MLITHKFKMALDRRGVMPMVDAVQGDSKSRAVEITLTSDNQNWNVPADVTVFVRFRKPDGTGGIYDTMPDGTAAITVAGNVITALLAPQMLSVPGCVLAQMELKSGEQTIATFTFAIRVEADHSIGTMDSEDYINLSEYVSGEVKRVLASDGLAKAFFVTVRLGEDSGAQTADKTFEETLEAYNAGKDIICAVYSGVYLVGVSPMVCKAYAQKWFECTVTGQAGDNPIRFVSVQIDLRGNDPAILPQCHAAISDIAAKAEELTIEEERYDGSAKVDMTGAVEAVVERKMMSVKRAGAVGDGSTDDTAAFQKAMSESRVVYVPGGTYKLSDTMVIKENSGLILSQDTILKFTQTNKNCIEMRGSAVLRGNHGILSAPYGLTAHVIDMDTLKDGTDHATSIPPYVKSSPQFKRQRFVHDVNIIMPTYVEGSVGYTGFCTSLDGTCSGTAIYVSATNVSNTTKDIPWMWAINMSGIRIAGGFSYGIHAINYDTAEGSSGHYEDDGWNHDMRIEAVIEGCEIGVALENCNGAHLNVTVQPCVSARSKTPYAKHGVYLNDSKYVDMMRSRIWDWDANRTLWTPDGQYQHLALIGNCRGLLLDDFNVHERSADIRSLIYTDTPGNFDTMTILQEPANKLFKSVNNRPYFYDGTANRSLRLKSDKITAEDTHFIHSASGQYVYTPKFTNLVPTSIDTDGSVYNGKGYRNGAGLNNGGGTETGLSCTVTGFIPVGDTPYHTYRVAGSNIAFNRYGCSICFYDKDFNFLRVCTYSHVSQGPSSDGVYYQGKVIQEETTLLTWIADLDATSGGSYVANVENAAYVRIGVGGGRCTDLAVTIDEKVEYDAEWQGEPQRMDESIYAQNVVLTSPSGKVFKLTIDDSGNITPTEFTE